MRIRRAEEPPSELINLTSLIDVMFILIIFFLATTTFYQEERDVKVNLPDASDGQTLSSETSVLVVNVREDGSYLLGTQTMTLPAMQQALVQRVKEKPEQKVLVRGDERSLHGHVAAAVLTCKRAGIQEANIGYDLPQ